MVRRPKLYAIDSPRGIIGLGLTLATLGYALPIDLRWVTLPLVFFVPGNAVVSAIFGRQLEFGGVRRAGLCGVMSLVAYSIMALTVFGLGFRLSHLSVVLSVATLSLACGAIVALRTKRWPEFAEPRHAEYARKVSPQQVVVPLIAMASALLVAYGSVKVLPRKPADEYSAIAFDGTWALTNRVVRVDATRDVQIQYEVKNQTMSVQTYIVRTRILGGDEWATDVVTVDPHDQFHGSAVGRVLEGSCSSRLEVLLEQEGSDLVRDPLVLYFRDTNADC